MIKRIPVTTILQLAALDAGEIVEGYHDGRQNFPCGDNRSNDYHYGWKNGMVDGGHAAIEEAQRILAEAYVKDSKK